MLGPWGRPVGKGAAADPEERRLLKAVRLKAATSDADAADEEATMVEVMVSSASQKSSVAVALLAGAARVLRAKSRRAAKAPELRNCIMKAGLAFWMLVDV